MDSEVPKPCRHFIGRDKELEELYTMLIHFKYCSRIIHHEMHLAFDYHSLRHTHATLLIESGANVKDVQSRLGHTNIETIADLRT